jgi:hypothetical protein
MGWPTRIVDRSFVGAFRRWEGPAVETADLADAI